jgi:hypothetical protein
MQALIFENANKAHYTKGLIWVYFSRTKEFFSWDIADWG